MPSAVCIMHIASRLLLVLNVLNALCCTGFNTTYYGYSEIFIGKHTTQETCKLLQMLHYGCCVIIALLLHFNKICLSVI